MNRYFTRHPLQLVALIMLGLLTFGALARPLVELLVPSASQIGLRVVVNWLFVILVVGLVTRLGWWQKVRLTAPVERAGWPYLLVLAVAVGLPLAVTVLLVPDAFQVPGFTLFDGMALPAWGVVLVVLVGFALGAALSEELLYRGVVMRALEPYGRPAAALSVSLLFGLAHLSLLLMGVPLAEVLPIAIVSGLTAVGITALAFRIGSLWPLIGWHLLQDSYPAFLTPDAMAVFVPVAVGTGLVVSLVGAWLLWTDRHLRVPLDADVAGVPAAGR